MRIRIFQIDSNTEVGVKQIFRNYENTTKDGPIEPGIYKVVFEGYIALSEGAAGANALKEIYTICNTEPPVGYNGHSLFVSDIVELEDGSCYFCDSIGFKELSDFDASKVASNTEIVVGDHGEGGSTEQLRTYIVQKIEALLPYIYGGEQRSNDLWDAGYADGAYNAYINVLNALGVEHNYKKVD